MHLVRNCARILVLICSLKRTGFRERSSRKTMSFKELLLSKDKRTSIIRARWRLLCLSCYVIFLQRGRLNVHEKFTFHWLRCSFFSVRWYDFINRQICPFSAKTPKHCLILNFILNTDFRDSLREYYPIFLCSRWGILSNVTFWDQTRSSKNISWITVHNYSLKWRWVVVDIYRAATEPQTQR